MITDDQLDHIAVLMWADGKWMARARVHGAKLHGGRTPSEAVAAALAAHGLGDQPNSDLF